MCGDFRTSKGMESVETQETNKQESYKSWMWKSTKIYYEYCLRISLRGDIFHSYQNQMQSDLLRSKKLNQLAKKNFLNEELQ